MLRKSVDLKVTWHDPCHLKRGQGITEEPLNVIRSILGLKVLEMKDLGRCYSSGEGLEPGRDLYRWLWEEDSRTYSWNSDRSMRY